MAGRKAGKIPQIDLDGSDFQELEVESRRLAAWSDDRRISPAQLASLLRMSPRKLLDLRRAGAGPDYYKGGARVDGSKPAWELEEQGDARAGNARILYAKQDFYAWLSVNKIVSIDQESPAMAGMAIRRFETVSELLAEAAFWIDAQGRIAGFVDDSSDEEFARRFVAWDIEWLPVAEAAARAWSDPARHRDLASAVVAGLGRLSRQIDANVLRSEMLSETPLPKPPRTER